MLKECTYLFDGVVGVSIPLVFGHRHCSIDTRPLSLLLSVLWANVRWALSVIPAVNYSKHFLSYDALVSHTFILWKVSMLHVYLMVHASKVGICLSFTC